MGRPALDLSIRFVDKYIPEPNSGCWIWVGDINDSGYGIIDIKRRKPVRTRTIKRAHRLSYELYRGIIPGGLHVCHSCDMPCCVNPDHLFLGTDKDNSDDKIKKGRYRHPRLKGIDHGMAKLSEAQVLEIRGSRARLRDISSRYGIGLSQASRLRNGQGWKHLP